MKYQARPPGRESAPRLPMDEERVFASAMLNKGMVTHIDPADIDPGAVQLARNCYVRFDKLMRRFGTSLVTPAKPDALPVLKVVNFKLKDGTAYTLRITTESVHQYTTGAWEVFAGTLVGSIIDRIRTALVLDKFVFANNGQNEIQLVDPNTETFADLRNSEVVSTKFRYVTGFFNRVVGAALRGVDETLLGWSGDGVAEEWDPLIDRTAGSAPLVESASDLSDHIKGVFGFTNVMIIVREKSIMLANKQPVPTNPFYVYTAVPDTGCDCPHSIVPVRGGGIAFCDRRTSSVYTYFPGQQPVPISQNVDKELFKNIADPETVFGGFDPVNLEYSVCVPVVGSSLVLEWRYNLRTQAWTKNERYGLTTIDDAEFFAGGGITIDELVGLIDDLTGDIDGLGGTSTAIASFRVYGHNDGTLASEDKASSEDAAHEDFPSGVVYETEVISKMFSTPVVDNVFSMIEIEYQAIVGGTFVLEYSRNGGATNNSWILAKTYVVTNLNEPKLIIYKRGLRCRKLAWRIRTSSGVFEFLSFVVKHYTAGESRE